MTSPQIDRIVSLLWQPVDGRTPLNVYALVDAARSESIYPKIMGAKVASVCLHRGKTAEELAWVAPYLVQMQREDSFTEWLLDSGWGKSRYVFVRSSATLHELKRHFRTFLTVYDEEGKSYFFRFYDPRVMRVYLPTCNENELEIIYGPVARYYIEGKEEKQLVEYICTDEFNLVQNEINL
ncbi:MAG: DUF4123 domain-containing protein [Desulfobulbaceae bacterium]|nr:DUF4123 domain-containing protein [Desulfobulbaceae bacterium]